MAQVHWTSIAALVLVILMAAFLVYLWKKGYIGSGTIKQVGDIIEGLPVIGPSDSFLEQLKYYADYAIDAVEQMVNSGAIEHDNKKRVQAAVEMVQTYAKLDGTPLDGDGTEAARSIIEAEIFNKPHSEG